MEENKDFNKGKFSREEFERHLIKDDDLTITSCCKRQWYKTKKNYKCPGCKKNVTKDIIGRGIMQGIDKMMKEREKEENEKNIKNKSDSKASDDKS
tara:strand:+ start:480 stop:767 length:288 start_codon:yes stop_codon:yes gene_type:complete